MPAEGTTVLYARWFAGDNETDDHPNAGMSTIFRRGPSDPTVQHRGDHHLHADDAWQHDDAWRGMDASLGGAVRAADMKVYWGNPGRSTR
jgi:hypothetical protein